MLQSMASQRVRYDLATEQQQKKYLMNLGALPESISVLEAVQPLTSLIILKVKDKVPQSYLTLCDPVDYTVRGILKAKILEWEAFHFLGDLPNPGLLHCGQILYQLSHKRGPRILEWVAYPSSSGSSWPRNRTRVSCIAGRFFYQLSYQGSPTLNQSLKQKNSAKQ